MDAICMSEEYWANSQFSIVRHYGHLKIDGKTYIIVNKHGQDIFECSMIAERAGRQKAIEPGEPCDLCRTDFVPFYKKLGRDEFLKVLSANPRKSDLELKNIFKAVVAEKKAADAEEKARKDAEQAKREPKLFD